MRDGIYFSKPSRLKPPTLLYGMTLRGAGTGNVESINSYFHRLAFAHRVSPRVLGNFIRANATELKASETSKLEWLDMNPNRLNGTGSRAKAFTQILVSATGQATLNEATLLGLSKHLAEVDLLTQSNRVCTECLRDDLRHADLPYERLIWCMKCVTCCPTHGIRLTEHVCGVNRREASASFARAKHSGVCGNCGSIALKCGSSDKVVASPSEIWRADQCIGAIENLKNISAADQGAVKANMTLYMSEHGGLMALARRSGVSKGLLSRWMNSENARMALPHFIDITFSEGLSLAAFLEGKTMPCVNDLPGNYALRARRVVNKCDHDLIRAKMREAMETEMTTVELAKKLKVDIATLAHHADLYAPLRDARKAETVKRTTNRRVSAVQKAETVAEKLLKRGQSLTTREVRTFTKEVWHASSLASTALKLLRIRLGLQGQIRALPRHQPGQEFLSLIEAAALRLLPLIPKCDPPGGPKTA